MAQSLEQMGNDARIQSGQGTGTMSELVFNPTTGEFETVAQGSAPSGSNMIVTEMTNNSSLKFEIKAKQFYAASQRVL